MNRVTRSYWEKVINRPKDYSNYENPFHDVLVKYIRYAEGKEFLEVGCAPGRNLIYFNRIFGFIPYGIDYVRNIDIVEENLKNHDIKKFTLFNKDFITFNLDKRYHVVGSFGFIEHFEQWELVLEKIINLTKKGGYIITSLPNFRYVQYFFRKHLTPEVIKQHNIDAMNKRKLERFFEDM